MSTNSNLGMYVTNNGGSLVSGLNIYTMTWTGSLSSQSSASDLAITYGTIHFTGDVSGYNGKITVNDNGASDGQGSVIIDGTLNPAVSFAWGSHYDNGTNSHWAVINSNNPSITNDLNGTVVNNHGYLIAGAGTTNAFGDGSATNILNVNVGTIGGYAGAVIPQNIHLTSQATLMAQTAR